MSVISIDLDFLFPQQYLYVEKLRHDLPPAKSWELLQMEYGKDFLPICHDSLLWLDEVVDKVTTPSTIHYFIDEHDEIMPILYKHGPCDVLNIDFHHDVDYQGEGTALSIANWVIHGYNEKLIKEYAWIGQKQSEMCSYRLGGAFCKQSEWQQVSPADLPKADVLVFCMSQHFTPPRYWELFRREYGQRHRTS